MANLNNITIIKRGVYEKNYFLLFIVGAIYAQQVPENKTVYPNRWGCITQNTNTSNTKTYSYSTETNVGREIVVVDSADTTFIAYRSYFYFNAVALPSNATNISVRVTTITSFTDGFSFTLKKPSTINQSTASTAWDQIRDGVQMLPISISYGTNTNFSSEIQAAFVSSFENGKDFIIAVYNPSDSSEANTKSMFSISLEVTYVRPAVLNSFNVDNIPSGGSVNVDRDGYTFNLQCPGTFTAYENQAISLEAIDIQVIGGLTYGFNDVEGDSNKSVWGNISAVTGLFEPRTLSQTMSFTGASTLKKSRCSSKQIL